MIRNVVGAVLALAGATAAVLSPFRAWYDGRHGRDYALGELFTGITGAKADLWWSLLLPFALAALLALVGVVLRSRPLVALAGFVVLGFTVFWMVRVGQYEGSLTVGGGGAGLGDGVANALGGGILLLLGALVMSGRRREARKDPEERTGRTWPEEPRAYAPPADGPDPREARGPDPREAPVADPYGAPAGDPRESAAPGSYDPYGSEPTRTFEMPDRDQGRDQGRDPDQDGPGPR
ncbi:MULTISPECIES: hypothetical protein [unclassified Streptomyces]|uniref:hypothetical protein n=1 Tax=unclassified Streptomyces TaxID=2593676 RepID=UPI0006AE6C5D|nr:MULTISPECIES: hypothetical protein [unclassified Streptomyces]KOX36460.1 hypothetical protein ADL06_04930 [Streptomyces sp. NRRL F-6491]KOX51341.1 hypothetical protein ADL08_04625 [Streptomyces sp. NRRL F-6492]